MRFDESECDVSYVWTACETSPLRRRSHLRRTVGYKRRTPPRPVIRQWETDNEPCPGSTIGTVPVRRTRLLDRLMAMIVAIWAKGIRP